MSKLVDINIYEYPLSIDYKEIETKLSEDKMLMQAIQIYSEMLHKRGIETFKMDRNMAVTENGYVIAMYNLEMMN